MTVLTAEVVTSPAGPYHTEQDPAVALAEKFATSRRSAETGRAYQRDVRHWVTWCRARGLDPLGPIRHTDVLDWQSDLRDRYAEASMARMVAAVASWYRWLLRERVPGVTRNPAAELERQERPVVNRDHSTTAVLSTDERRALMAAADALAAREPNWLPSVRAPVITWVLWAGGVRVGELLGADVEDIGWDRGTPNLLVRGKGRKQRTIPLPPALYGRIQTYLALREDIRPDLLPAVDGQAAARRPLLVTRYGTRVARNEVWRLLRRLAGYAELHHVAHTLSPHSLRHTMATEALRDGVPLQDVQDALGHADPRTTRRYDRRAQDPDRHPTWRLLSKP
ncbi:tyrosine-type recombinase/integrase [Salinispora arenicola]|uniref:tyrosine-type recombinase/integrase n=1 Tax=Salinispora arenicola TaxID=168697 RepID=UPI00037EC560|nr:tyrosine-type recombinase/integrase [Salinispora arenicola]